ncbi:MULTISPECIES: type II toxin-antitoxin system Phd/YefM family antitoxin [unclassified Frankia]|uniref:type II toxin-antitoxin system Phd/YefM family antitoxin n=1 Tax=unclassified Frankia TaxID=2632575 RepID=UPI002AD4A4D7|nr:MULTISPECIES: type II toxin-antitoxin system Phd/YefM family antitoxin [unclassified Frankia]
MLYISIMIAAAHKTDLRASEVEIGIAEVRSRLGEVVNRVHEGDVVYLTRNGTPTAAILPIDELRRLVEAEEGLEDLRAVVAADRCGSGSPTSA